MLDDMATAGNTSCDGLDTVPNTTAGWPVPLSMIAKPSIFGWTRRTWVKPLGSFFPLGFLMPPDRALLVDVDHFTLIYSFTYNFCLEAVRV